MTHSGDHRLSKACRTILRGADREDAIVREHVEVCAFCREWLQRREHLIGLLAQPVKAPAELHSPELLEGIRERIVESCESSSLGQVLDRAMPVVTTPGAEEWPPPGLESDLLESGLAAQIRQVNVGPPEWSDVRDSMLNAFSVQRAGRMRNRMLASAGVAAAIVMCALLLRETERSEQPQFVFTDVTSLSAADYLSPMNVLRNGGRR